MSAELIIAIGQSSPSGISLMRNAVLTLIGLAMLLLAGCIALPVPPLGSQIGQEEIGTLKPGVSTREDVHDALGDPDHAMTDRYELFELSKETGYLTVITILPGIAGTMRAGGQDFRVLAEYTPDGILRSLRWEGRVEGEDGVRYISHDGQRTIAGPATPQPSLAWGDPRAYRAVAASPDGHRLAISYYGKPGGILLRDGQTGAVLADIAGSPAGCPSRISEDVPLLSVFVSDSRHLASLVDATVVCFWNRDAQEHGGRPSFFTSRVRLIDLTSARYAPILAIVDDEGVVGIWNGLNGSRIASVIPCPSEASCPSPPKMALSDDGRFLATLQKGLGSFWAWRRSQRNVLTLWDARTGTEITSLDLPVHSPLGGNLAWSPDRRRLALNFGNHVQVWRVGHAVLETTDASEHGSQLEQVLPLPPTWLWTDLGKMYPEAIPSIAFAADGSRLAAGYASAVVWEVGTWRQVWRAAAAGHADMPEATFSSGFVLTDDGERSITTCCMWRLPEADKDLGPSAKADGATLSWPPD